MRTLTLYFDPSQGILHSLVCEVEDNGTHKVVDSDVSSCTPIHFPSVVKWGEDRYGADKLRAYTVAEYKPASYPATPARLDSDGTAKPLSRIVGHARPGDCQGPGIDTPDHIETNGVRIPLSSPE